MLRPLLACTVLSLLAVESPSVHAEPVVENMGLRIGGWGYRESPAVGEEQSTTGWQAGRMNGVGLFADTKLSDPFFAEVGFDLYFADEFVVSEAMDTYDTPMDRSSGILTFAVGARFYEDAFVSPYLQLGAGVELTNVQLPVLGLEDTAVLPTGFFGVGGDVHIAEGVKIGASLRVNAMGYYDDAQFQTELDPKFGLATQMQFYAGFAL